MTSNLPDKTLLSTIPALPDGALVMSKQELADRVGLLDAGDVGQVEITRWLRAAANGKWTADELLAAVDWLNENHTGYVKVAHVHNQILVDRRTLRRARLYCWQHPLAIEVVSEITGKPMSAQDVKRFWQDYRYEWLNDGIADKVMAKLPDEQWKRWAIKNDGNFRGEL